MKEIPACDFLKGHCDEHTGVDNLKFVGEFYANQIAEVCGGYHLGDVVKAFSNKNANEIKTLLRRCCRNKRAGEKLPTGKVIGECNPKVMETMTQLLLLARKDPSLFEDYKANICTRSASLAKLCK